MTVYIQLTTIGTDAGPFNLYANGDGYASAFATGITSAQLSAGFPAIAPDGTTIIRAKSAGVCTNYIDVPVVLLPVTTSTTVTTAPPIPTCPDQVLVFQICNSNSVRDDNFDIILNGTSIGVIDLSASAQVGGLFIGSTNPALTVTAPDFACPLGLMVVNRFNPNLLHYGVNNIHMKNVQNNNSGNYGTVELRSYTLVGNNLVSPCKVADMTYSGGDGESFDLSFNYVECCSGPITTVPPTTIPPTTIPPTTAPPTTAPPTTAPPTTAPPTTSTTTTRASINLFVNSMEQQTDNKFIAGGAFYLVNGLTRRKIVRFNSNWQEDAVFGLGIGTGFGDKFGAGVELNNYVQTTKQQPDGKILVGGNFTLFNSVVRNRFVRLNADGTEDTTFCNNLGFAFEVLHDNSSGSIMAIKFQSPTQFLVAGYFALFNLLSRSGLIRLNLDGSEDTAFAANLGSGFTNSQVYTIAVQSDGKIVAGGVFTGFNGNGASKFARLNANGTPDTAFNTNLGAGFTNVFDKYVNKTIVQLDGKILVGGLFSTFKGVTRNNFVRLNSDGTEDTAFYINMGTAFNDTIYDIVQQPDGKIIVVGRFSTFNGLTRNYIVRLNNNGTEDTTFYTNIGGVDGNVITVSIIAGNKILIGGNFNNVNGSPRSRYAILNPDGTLG